MAKQNWTRAAVTIFQTDSTQSRITIHEQDLWALERLWRAGCDGCTPEDNPAPHCAALCFSLRRAGVDIEKIHEKHRGDFPGHHARDVLKSRVTRAVGRQA